MKIKTIIAAAIITCLVMFSAVADAQYRGGRYHGGDRGPAYRPGQIQITPFAGFLFGDEYDASVESSIGGDIEQDDSGLYGIRVGFGIAHNIGLEFQFSHAETEFYGLDGYGLFNSRTKLSDADVYHILGNVNFDFHKGPIVPYLALGLGTTIYDMKNGGSDSEFTGTMAGGLKGQIAPNIALRLEVRGYVTQVQDTDYSYYYDGYYYDWVNTNDDYLTTWETSLGLSFIL